MTDSQVAGPVDKKQDDRATFNEVLLHELRSLRPNVFDESSAATFQDTADQIAANLRELYQAVGALGAERSAGDEGGEGPSRKADQAEKPHDSADGREALSALCLSGGGIRSATFNLGVLQGLAHCGLLAKFDYLSSVSGGGYIAGWLRAWMKRDGCVTVIRQLASTVAGDMAAAATTRPAGVQPLRDPLDPEPRSLAQLREYSNYLTPRLGLLSADTWACIAIIVRNLLLNWLVIVPALVAVIALPQLLLLALQGNTPGPYTLGLLLTSAVLAALVASHYVYRLRRRPLGTGQWSVVLRTVLPLSLACILLASAAVWLPTTEFPDSSQSLEGSQNPGPSPAVPQNPSPSTVSLQTPSAVPRDAIMVSEQGWAFAALWCLVIPIIGWVFTEPSWRKAQKEKGENKETFGGWGVEFTALIVSGLVATALFVLVVWAWRPTLLQYPALYVVVTVPLLLGIYLFARVLFVAIASGQRIDTALRTDDADREWWARLSGWVLIVALVWLVATAVCLLGGYVWQEKHKDVLQLVLTGMAGVSGVVTALLGKSANTASGRDAVSKRSSSGKERALALAAPLFCVCTVILLAEANMLLGQIVTGHAALLTNVLQRDDHVTATVLLWFGALILIYVLISFSTGWFVNVNRFSLHGLYRNRLVRAYLGASNSKRHPDLFTGFDPKDNLLLHELWSPNTSTRPLSLIGATLNIVSGERLAWQQRKSESFSMTPFFCGNYVEGYRPSNRYTGAEGISLGTAMAISGAAANPNMGYHSSAVIMFLMGLFNARLGAWFGNVNNYGDHTYTRPGPRHALSALLAELFGGTSAKKPFVNLSDGGHFENLGLYEVVLRRCRYVLACDAGCDPDAGFEDLGNAIRKIRIDFGIPIEFERKILIFPRKDVRDGLYCATAKIRYDAVDGNNAPEGRLVYIKPALFGRGSPLPYDVFSYSVSSDDFPHETTADQWFSEAQFESYRILGLHAFQQISKGSASTPIRGFDDFLDRVATYVGIY